MSLLFNPFPVVVAAAVAAAVAVAVAVTAAVVALNLTPKFFSPSCFSDFALF